MILVSHNQNRSTVLRRSDHAIIDTWQSGQVEFTIRGCMFNGDDRWWSQCGIFHEYLESASWIRDDYGAWGSVPDHDWFSSTVDGSGYGVGNHSEIVSTYWKCGLFGCGVGLSNIGGTGDGAPAEHGDYHHLDNQDQATLAIYLGIGGSWASPEIWQQHRFGIFYWTDGAGDGSSDMAGAPNWHRYCCQAIPP